MAAIAEEIFIEDLYLGYPNWATKNAKLSVRVCVKDAIWFTAGPLNFDVVKKYQKFDEKACYTVKNVLKMGCIKCFSI